MRPKLRCWLFGHNRKANGEPKLGYLWVDYEISEELWCARCGARYVETEAIPSRVVDVIRDHYRSKYNPEPQMGLSPGALRFSPFNLHASSAYVPKFTGFETPTKEQKPRKRK